MVALTVLAALLVCLFLTCHVIRHKNNRQIIQAESRIRTDVQKHLNSVDLDKACKLMIVAHPDDETFWGGGHLLQDKGAYLVVFVTGGTVPERDKELHQAMQVCDAQYLLLGYPDLNPDGRINDWKELEFDIKATLKVIIGAKDWDRVVTHNPHGEYGHKHHRRLSRYMTCLYQHFIKKDNLFYFGIYYKEKYRKLLEKHARLPAAVAKDKIEKMIVAYPSQLSIQHEHEHMFHYEDWINAKDWNRFGRFLEKQLIKYTH